MTTITDIPTGHTFADAHRGSARGGQDTAAATTRLTPTDPAPLRVDHPADHASIDTHAKSVGGVQIPAAEAMARAIPSIAAPRLLDEALHETLKMAAEIVDDLERVRIANENRHRQLTRTDEDADGITRGLAIDPAAPEAAVLGGIIDALTKIEHQAILNLQRAMRRHPLGPWVKEQKGIGEKQAARLLAAIGDPYLRVTVEDDGTITARPRTVSALWAYCGLHTLPASHERADTHHAGAGGVASSCDGPAQDETAYPERGVWVAARRARGQKANWSATAKMRAWNIAGSCIKQAESPYRVVYDARRADTATRVHAAPCVRCGPSGKPAQPGTPWSAGHQHADALRIVSKTILRDLWRAARDLHEQP